MFNVYFTMLLEQYKRSIGAKTIDLKSKEFVEGFYNWATNQKNYADTYFKLLECMKIYNYSDGSTAEVGKGKYDSIVTDLDTTIITPYSRGIEVNDQDRIIKASFRVSDGKPSLIVDDTNKKKRLYDLAESIGNGKVTFMTQNPYTSSCIKNWEQLHNSGDSNIIVGVYGNLQDKDRNSKIKELRELRDKLHGKYIEEGATCDGNYFYAIGTQKEIHKVNVKILK